MSSFLITIVYINSVTDFMRSIKKTWKRGCLRSFFKEKRTRNKLKRRNWQDGFALQNAPPPLPRHIITLILLIIFSSQGQWQVLIGIWHQGESIRYPQSCKTQRKLKTIDVVTIKELEFTRDVLNKNRSC